MRFSALLVVVALALPGIGCGAHVALSREALGRIDKVAVTTRVIAGPTVVLSHENHPGQDPGRLASAVAKALRDTVTRAEVAAFVRADFSVRLNGTTDFEVAEAVAVDTALGSLLVDEAPELRDYRPLKRLGIDAVLEIDLIDYGINDEGPPKRPGWFIEIEGRLVEVGQRGDERSVSWRHRELVNGSAEDRHEVDVQALLNNTAFVFREGFGAAASSGTSRLFGDLGLRVDSSR